ncbi:MAG: hypothetical protein ABI426_01425 [Flavobacterium sp.]
MKTRDNKALLMQKIVFLENKQTQELQSLKEQVQVTFESLKPLNFIKSTFQEVTSTPGIGTDLLMGAFNLAKSYLSNEILNTSNSKNPVKKVLGSALKFVVKKFSNKK